MKKLISIILTVCLLASLSCFFVSASAASVVDSGELEGFTWSVSSDGTLSIEGSGMMPGGLCLQWSEDAGIITNVVVGEGILSIENEFLFYGKYPVTSVKLPSTLLTIGSFAFQGCESLKEITIPSSVKSIGEAAFENCTSLKSLTLPESVTTVPSRLCNNCTALTTVKLSSSTVSIGTYAFSDCTALRSIDLPDTLSIIGNAYGMSFQNCKSLVTVTVPGSIGAMTGMNFYKCTALKTAIVSEGVTVMDGWNFADCTAMKAIYLPATLTSIGGLEFSNCTALTDVYYGGSQAQWKNITIDSNANDALTRASIHYNASPAQASLGAQYTDVSASDWFCDTVSWAAANGTATGNSATTFNPKGTLTVAEMLQMLYNQAGRPAVSAIGTEWYAKARGWAVSEGYISASDAVTGGCSRQMVVEMIYRAAGSPAVRGTSPFSDASGTAVTWAYENKVTQGYGNGIFKPTNTLTRAEAVQFIRNAAAL